MRHIQIPAPVEVEMFGQDGQLVEEPDGGPVMYSMQKLNEQNVWSHEYWRKDSSTLEMFESIYEKFEASGYDTGKWVSLSDEEYEAYKPIATMQGQKIRPDIAPQLMKIMRPILRAPKKLPDEKVEAEAPAGN